MTYYHTHDEVPPNSKMWQTLTDAQRLTLIEDIRVKYPRLDLLIDALDNCAQYADTTISGIFPCLAIVGLPAVGKTTLVEIWIQYATALHVVLGEEQAIPFVHVCLPAQLTSRGILATCLAELGDPAPLKGSSWGQTQRLQQLIHTLKVRLFVIDKLQHIVDRETHRIRYNCLDTLKSILTQAEISMVVVGCTEDIERILSVAPWLERLVGSPHFLQPFEWDRQRPTTINEFCTLMKIIDHALPFDDSGFAEREMAYCWYYATNGVLGWIMRLLQYAARKAVYLHEVTLSRLLLAEAYQACIAETDMGYGKVNPFAVPHFSEPEEK